VPALYQLHRKGRLPAGTRVVGCSRTPFSDDQWRDSLAESTAKFAGDEFDRAKWDELAPRIHYHATDISKAEDFAGLATFLREIEGDGNATRVYYLATSPDFYEPAVAHLGAAGMADESNGPRRVVIEKPFGTDLETSQALNSSVRQVFEERQIYRIDHYLGKETVQNLLVLRFANTIFEPVWNRNYIDHVQITVAEEVNVGSRAGYYDAAGVIRDMFQNHLLQLMMITAMEAPAKFAADAIRNEKVKVLQAVRPMDAAGAENDSLRGQYTGYRDAKGVSPGSRTATFGAIRLWVDNWRWQGVPFFLRSGKAMSCRTTQIVIQFRAPPHIIFPGASSSQMSANQLVVQVQPAEGIQLHFQTKVPDAGMKLRQTDLDFNYRSEFRHQIPDSYQRLLLDALEGDASLFARADEVEAAWAICDPIQHRWDNNERPTLFEYEPGYWGPTESTDWMASHGKQWFDTCPVLKCQS
jgi:glucose-6-phosphate 1-dehydrogenase